VNAYGSSLRCSRVSVALRLRRMAITFDGDSARRGANTDLGKLTHTGGGTAAGPAARATGGRPSSL
jgi:hypothetical protein